EDDFEALAENNSKVCGRFSAFQLNRSIFPHIQINHSIYPKVLLGAALATCSIYPAFSQDSFAKILTEASQINNKIQSNQPGPEFGKDSTKYIKGKIVDSKTGEPVPFATILIKELKTGAVADLNGNFKIEVKDSFPIYLPLTISALAYDETQLMLHKNKLLDFIEIKISPSEYEIVGDVIIIDDTKSKKKSQKKNKRP
ncbi:MAG: carboxypeptidase-like regulatory domain-containing protein, partial [Bacteroidia bacterium]